MRGAVESPSLRFEKTMEILQDPTKWEILNYDQFKQRCRVARFGVVDVLAQCATLHWEKPDGEIDGLESLGRASVLQDGSASSLFRGGEHGLKALNPAAISAMCATLPFMMANEQPDGCNANRRKKAATREDSPDNVIIVLRFPCRQHPDLN